MEVPRFNRLKGQYLRLEGSICSNCNEPSFPPRNICPHCDGKSQTQYSTRGEVVPYSQHLLNTQEVQEKVEEFNKPSHEVLVYQASIPAAD